MDTSALFQITQANCKVCTSQIRGELDDLLLREVTFEDGKPYTLEEIKAYAEERGLVLSIHSLSRHRRNHLQPAVQQMLATQRQVDAIAEKTGKRLPLASVFTNMVLDKTIRLMNDMDEEDFLTQFGNDPKLLMKMLAQANNAAKHVTNIEKAEGLLEKERVAEKVAEAGAAKGISKENLEFIKREVLGMVA